MSVDSVDFVYNVDFVSCELRAGDFRYWSRNGVDSVVCLRRRRRQRLRVMLPRLNFLSEDWLSNNGKHPRLAEIRQFDDLERVKGVLSFCTFLDQFVGDRPSVVAHRVLLIGRYGVGSRESD